MEAKDILEKCVATQDFSHASVLKERIIELEGIKSGLLKEAEESETKEICVEKVLYFTLAPVFTVFSHLHVKNCVCDKMTFFKLCLKWLFRRGIE